MTARLFISSSFICVWVFWGDQMRGEGERWAVSIFPLIMA
jgi:hypothetical protein